MDVHQMEGYPVVEERNPSAAPGFTPDNGFFGQEPQIEEFFPVNDLPVNMPPLQEDAEIANLSQAFTRDVDTSVDSNGVIHIEGEPDQENATRVQGKIFGSAESDEINKLADAMQDDSGYFVDEFGRIHMSGEPGAGVNMTRVDGNVFGAHEDQWYNKNKMLFQAEVATMRKHYPRAGYSFYPSNGNMYWLVTLKIFQTEGVTRPWVFQLVYDKDHPNNHGFGGSIKVVPIKPSLDELKQIATRHGRPGVPHVISNESHFLSRYLCTRWPSDIADGSTIVASATQAAAWAADWAAHFEVGIRDACVWNKWCNDDHFRWMQVTCNKRNCPYRTCPYGKRG